MVCNVDLSVVHHKATTREYLVESNSFKNGRLALTTTPWCDFAIVNKRNKEIRDNLTLQ